MICYVKTWYIMLWYDITWHDIKVSKTKIWYHDMMSYLDVMIWFHNMIPWYDIIIWYHNMISVDFNMSGSVDFNIQTPQDPTNGRFTVYALIMYSRVSWHVVMVCQHAVTAYHNTMMACHDGMPWCEINIRKEPTKQRKKNI